jgi:hypothetical protein
MKKGVGQEGNEGEGQKELKKRMRQEGNEEKGRTKGK